MSGLVLYNVCVCVCVCVGGGGIQRMLFTAVCKAQAPGTPAEGDLRCTPGRSLFREVVVFP